MNILVIGESCTDIFVYGNCTRLCPEAPVPVLNPIDTITTQGMAANVVANLKSCGAEQVDLITNENPINKVRYVDAKSNQMVIRVDHDDWVTEQFKEPIFENFKHYDAVVVSDYDKGYLTVDNLRDLSYSNKLTFLDTKKPIDTWALGFNYIKINEPEWGLSVKNGANKIDWGNRLIVTRGSKGADYMGVNYPCKDNVVLRDVSGAGDTFLAGLVFYYLQSNDIIKSIEYANEVASIVVQKKGVSVAYE